MEIPSSKSSSKSTDSAQAQKLTDPYENPYFLHHSDSPTAVLVSPPLNGENYNLWFRAMRMALRAKNKMGFVDGTIPKPDPSSDIYSQWERVNDMICSWILHSIMPELSSSIIYSESALDIWNDLKERFSQPNGTKIYQLKRSLYECLGTLVDLLTAATGELDPISGTAPDSVRETASVVRSNPNSSPLLSGRSSKLKYLDMASEHTVPAEDVATSGDEVEQPHVPLQAPVGRDTERILAAMAQYTEQQAALMQLQTAQATERGTGTGLLERFRKLFTTEFGGSVSPGEAKEWLKSVVRVFDAMGVTDAQKVTLATFNLKGTARNWWEALQRQLTAPLPGVTPVVQRVVTWERFVKGFNDQYCPQSYRFRQEAAFSHLQQGDMTVPEYEARFAELSEYAPYMVDTEVKKCNRFRLGLSSQVATRLRIYETEDYAALVEMARKVGNDIQDYKDSQQSNKKNKIEGTTFGKSGGGSDKGGQQRTQGFGNQNFGKSQGGSSGGWKGKSGQGSGKQIAGGSTTTGTRQCFNCGSTDHLLRECTSGVKSFRCFACGETGHMAAQCPRRQAPAASSFLYGLDESYAPLRGQLLLYEPLPSVTKMYSFVLQEEKQRELSHTTFIKPEASALTANSNNASRNFTSSRAYSQQPSHSAPKGRPRPHCDHCNNDGHTIATCYKIHGYPPKKQGVNKNFNGSSSPRGMTVTTNHGFTSGITPTNAPPSISQDQYNHLLSLIPGSNQNQVHLAGLWWDDTVNLRLQRKVEKGCKQRSSTMYRFIL
ncbi:hypothetical protein RHSIM_Rhsim06G0111500 [Rhododendron simsii]|uniref:CCHC-type domain-containing protein n=1 Tax=Rhododendron simsii TaxID=118357 RepID=A0A834LKR4_RHOSS|nr:hypothetical protein RHSIM_Rhsim06G0111500 [Rhododendron simsii]